MALSVNELLIDVPNRVHNDALALSIEFNAGEVWGILGPNGAGKTTLLHTLAGLLAPRSGQVLLEGKHLSALHRLQLAQQVGIMFQEHQDGFPATVLEAALMGRFPHLSAWEMESEHDLRIAYDALKTLDLAELADRSIATLSGGERQRAALAALMTQQPDVWLADEPTNHLDLHHQVEVMALLKAQANAGKVVIMSLHDVNLAAQWCSHVLLLYPNQPPLCGRALDLLTRANLEPLYSQKLAVTELDGKPLFVPVANLPN